MKKNGFTLVEVLVASTIGSFIALVAVGSLRVIISGSEAVTHTINAAAEARFAASMISRDLVNIYRDKEGANIHFIGTVDELDDGSSTSHLLFHTLSRTPARAGQPEGDLYEVEYYLTKGEQTSALMRRYWPNPHEELDPGGILTVIAEDIDVFEITYFDGEEWAGEWPEEMQALPHLVEITIAAQETGSTRPCVESLTFNFVRAQGAEGATLANPGQAPNAQTPNTGNTTQGNR